MESESNCDTRDQMIRVQEQIAEVDHFILDVDLYSEAGLYEKLRDLYTFKPVPRNLEPGLREEAASAAGKERKEKVEKLGQVFSFLKSEESLATYCGPGKEYLAKVSSIHDAV